MEEPSIISTRVTETAKNTIKDARDIAKEAISDASAVDDFTAAKAVNTYFKAMDLALTSSLQVARDLIGVVTPAAGAPTPPKDSLEEKEQGRRLVADAMEAIARRMLRQAGEVAKETAGELDKNQTGPTVWAKSMVKLGDIALLGGIELAETALIGPAPFERDDIPSVDYEVTGSGRRELVVRPGGIARPGTVDPLEDIRFYIRDPEHPKDAGRPSKFLQGAEHTFYLLVSPVGKISGMYLGQIEVWTRVPQVKDDGTTVEVRGALVDVVDVELPL